VDDRLLINVWKNPELSLTVPVRPDGMVTMPLIGDVKAGGHTAAEVAESIRKKLSSYISEPSVAVIVTELRSHEFISRVRVTGAVRNPRSLPFRQGMTVLDAVLEAGGVNEFAAPNRGKLYRKQKGSSGTDVYDVGLGDILNKGRLDTNYVLYPGDVVTIPERLF
jgi:polysaccharide export outer membrane protein